MESVKYKRHPEFSHLFCGENGWIFSLKYKIFLKHSRNNKGYFVVNVGKRLRPVHRLIMETFVGFSELQVDHLNRDKSDNRLCNLEYVTNAENNRRSNLFRTWDKVRGENNVKSKLTESAVLKIRELKPFGVKERTLLALEFGISLSTVNDVLKRKTWKHL